MSKVTVLMPTYNVAPYIEEAIASVLRQTCRDFELLVLDDCSTDGTWEQVCQMSDPRIHAIRHERNLGLADNLNWGLDHIETEYVARMDGDDIAEPDWLEREVAFLDRHPDAGVCGGGFRVFGLRNYTVLFPHKAEAVAANMLFECSVTVPVFRRSLFRQQGLHYRSDAFPAEDYRFWADCLLHTRIYNITRVLFHYRMHGSQISTSLRDRQQRQSDAVRRLMLQRLNADISETDTAYFLERYARGIISDKDDYRQMRRFTRRLLQMNRESRYFNTTALRRRCRKQEVQALYRHITETYFDDGYSIKNYLHYAAGGCAWRTTFRYELKFWAKSLLHRTA
ncbi:MAG: family 2 glycosyl transferase [bacterium P3]|nr:MAG: family 2 glycosyl transferase [bacterium P201]KWW30482.1 MAG: family 2 glycosyl transferase [bacterium P3]KWW41369.1 MAG: family 2 glycosyl transferase [bacterium F083]